MINRAINNVQMMSHSLDGMISLNNCLESSINKISVRV